MDDEHLVKTTARVFELAGVGVLVAGALLAVGIFAVRMARRIGFQDAYHDLRADLGRAILRLRPRHARCFHPALACAIGRRKPERGSGH